MTHFDLKTSAADRLRYLQQMHSITTLQGLSHYTGVPFNTLKGVMKRGRIGSKTALQVASALNVPYQWVKTGEGEAPVPHSPIRFTHDLFAAVRAGRGVEAWPPKGEADSPAERIRALQEVLEFSSLSALAEASKVTVDALEEVLATDTIDAATAHNMAVSLGISYEWLLDGKGTMCKRGSEIEGYRGFPSGQAADRIVALAATAVPGAYFVQVPKAQTKLSAGGGIIPEEGMVQEAYAFRADWLKKVAWGSTILLDVDGDSMAPTLLNGDTVLIDLGRTDLREGRIYAIAVGDVVQIKRLQLVTGPKIRVIPDNPQFHTYEAVPQEVKIIGQMIWFARTTA